MSALLWLLAAVPLTAGTALLLTGRRLDRPAPALGVAAAAATLGLAVASAVLRPEASAPLFAGIRAGLRVDGLSAVMTVVVAAVTLAVLVFSAGEKDRLSQGGRFHGLMLLFAGAMLITVTATTLPLLLMAWEVMGAASWALIGFWWRQPQRTRAADTAFLTTRTADLGLYLAAGAALAGGVTALDLDALAGARGPWVHLLTAGVVAAAFGKSAQLPFSFWLSRAMQAPSPVSALLHAATMAAAGAYLLLRLHALLEATAWGGPLVAWTGAATALLLGVAAAAQRDLKQLLAASTCSQIGFMVLAAGTGGVAAGTAQLTAHAAVKAGLFLAAGAWLYALGTKQLPALRGAARAWQWVGAAFTACALALAGLPPLSLWAAKDEVLAAAFAQSAALYATGLAAAAVSAVYSVKALWYVLRETPGDAWQGYDTEESGTRRVTPLMRPPLLVLAAAAVALGVLALPGVFSALRDAVGTPDEPSPSAWQLPLSAAVALSAAWLAWRIQGRGPGPRLLRPAAVRRWAAGWLGLEQAARTLAVRPVLALARATAVFDDRVVDGAVHRAARAALTAAGLARRSDDGGVDALVRAVARTARRLGRAARRPQTGLLHQYYAQAAVGFAVLTLLLLSLR
ncbi:proton-conducting transporter transmembrane domain-containing protein [Streptomyces sp. MUM 178J]|uniref:proton-conducting transporter transmembrane domain-containing protein n=1 Tax=Streptomyces sp. MUM 178J TaxID=2791991 RepID=UPI001F03DCA4|nr:proton-conducting transporter membrane subunit [Streptomyces sp. MUM 178J]WRQ78045.1 proton-conducting transporter membrane subunit [Streptomyces sp. MUM 178J]